MACTDIIIKAKQFNPEDIQWPEEIVSWDKEEIRPKDGSWGYVKCGNNVIHVHGGDWIVTILKKKYICRNDKFKYFKKDLTSLGGIRK